MTLFYPLYIYWLVVSTPLKKIFDGKDYPKYEMEHQKSLKPPASIYICLYMFNGSLLYFITIHVQIWFTTSPAQASPGLVSGETETLQSAREKVKRPDDKATCGVFTMGYHGFFRETSTGV